MSWAEVFKINSNFAMPLNEYMDSMSFVKSIQKGTSKGTNSSDFSIAINTVNPDKAMVIITCSHLYSMHTETDLRFAILKSLTENTVTFSSHTSAFSASATSVTPRDFYWTVLEFA